jgi:hypothetical protein
MLLLRGPQSKPSLATHMKKQPDLMYSSGIKSFCQMSRVEMSHIDFTSVHAPTLLEPNIHITDEANTNSVS